MPVGTRARLVHLLLRFHGDLNYRQIGLNHALERRGAGKHQLSDIPEDGGVARGDAIAREIAEDIGERFVNAFLRVERAIGANDFIADAGGFFLLLLALPMVEAKGGAGLGAHLAAAAATGEDEFTADRFFRNVTHGKPFEVKVLKCRNVEALRPPPPPRVFLYVWQDKELEGRGNVSVAGIEVSRQAH